MPGAHQVPQESRFTWVVFGSFLKISHCRWYDACFWTSWFFFSACWSTAVPDAAWVASSPSRALNSSASTQEQAREMLQKTPTVCLKHVLLSASSAPWENSFMPLPPAVRGLDGFPYLATWWFSNLVVCSRLPPLPCFLRLLAPSYGALSGDRWVFKCPALKGWHVRHGQVHGGTVGNAREEASKHLPKDQTEKVFCCCFFCFIPCA